MKKNSWKTTALLVLPCVFILVIGAGVSRWRENERKKFIAIYSQPFTPHFQLQRSKLSGSDLPARFEAKVRCVSVGGSGLSQWLVRGVLKQTDKQPPQEIWNSQKATNSNLLTPYTSGSQSMSGFSLEGYDSLASKAIFLWCFDRQSKEANNLQFIVEAVAIPIPVAEDKLGKLGIRISEATPAQIAKAKREPGARYFREFIAVNAKDDQKFRGRSY